MSNEFEQQLGKLLSGEVSLEVAGDRIEETHAPDTLQPTTIGETSGSVTASVADSHYVSAQQELVRELRAAVLNRSDREKNARVTMEQELEDLQLERERHKEEVARIQRYLSQEVVSARLALEEIRMQYLPAEPMVQLPSQNTAPRQQLDILRNLAEKARTARRDLEQALDTYSRWWMDRFVRFLVFVGVLAILFYLLILTGGTILRAVLSAYSFVHSYISSLNPEWLSTVLWVLFLVGSIALTVGAIVYVFRFAWHRFLDTQDKRDETKSIIERHRSSLVTLVFKTESSGISRHFFGRMWLMVLFTLKRKWSRITS